MGLSLIIPTKNRNNILLKTISTALKILPKITLNYEIIVINDGDNDIFFDDLNVKLFKNKGSGVASARNYGVSLSKFNNLLFLDDDMLLTKGALTYYLQFFEDQEKSKQHCLNIHWKFPDELMTICKKSNFGRYLIKIAYTEMKGWMKNAKWIENNEFITPNLASYGLAITKENFEKVGGYNEKFPFAGFEDYDFSVRVNSAGIKVLLNTQYEIYHNEEDRISMNEWLQRRYREGATRAVYVELTGDRSMIIKHSFGKRVAFSLIYRFSKILIFKTKVLGISRMFDFIAFAIFNAIAGAYIWKGYTEYAKKN